MSLQFDEYPCKSYKTKSKIILFALLTNKPMFFVFKQHIKSGESSINAGDVLLQVHFVFISELFVGIDVLLQHS